MYFKAFDFVNAIIAAALVNMVVGNSWKQEGYVAFPSDANWLKSRKTFAICNNCSIYSLPVIHFKNKL